MSETAPLPFIRRRDFLTRMGFSLTAATLAACSRAPIEKAIPMLVQPEEITPGVANWYATTCGGCAAACALLVKTRDGRPIKVEGNPQAPRFGGGTCAVGQATVLSLYDEERLKGPLWLGGAAAWSEIDARVMRRLDDATAQRRSIVLLTSTIVSPSTRALVDAWCRRYPTCRHVVYDAIAHTAMRDANRRAFGAGVIPHYRFDKARIIVSLAADFLGTWLSPVEFARQYADVRRPENGHGMTRHVQVESRLSLTGANADVRIPVSPAEQGVVALELLGRVLALAGTANGFTPPRSSVSESMLDAIAADLWRHREASLVVAGANDVAIQTIVNALNATLGNVTSTIELNRAVRQHDGDDTAMAALLADMARGDVDVLLMHGVNPAYDHPDAKAFVEGLTRVGLTVSLADRLDETAAHAQAVCPDHHFLEAWNDAEPVTGSFSLAQPTIAPLFDTRAAQDSLLTWMRATDDYHEWIRRLWRTQVWPWTGRTSDFESFWHRSLHDGTVTLDVPAAAPVRAAVAWRSAATAIADRYRAALADANAGRFEVDVHESIAVRDGRHANNPWLQELPDPIASSTWGNHVSVAPSVASRLELRSGDVVSVSTGDAQIEAAVHVQPGHAPGAVSVALGYGRTRAGRVATGVGVNAFPLAAMADGHRTYTAAGATLSVRGRREPLALAQTHTSLEGRPIVLEATLATLDHLHVDEAEAAGESLWEEPKAAEHRWGLSIDLTACTGCSACVVACQAENNVPVVGKDEVRRGREMHWIRVDRYHLGSAASPRTVFQPMMCQHCNHAPCETVCPVLATVHSADGINQQIYNRCIGTRYCENNCPYKVRRFNWFQYAHNPHFEHTPSGPLEAMVLNPDVVVRSRGVMEKCSLCIQRIQDGRLQALQGGRPLRDGEIKTACQQACPTQAIVFGDLLDPTSRAAQLARSGRAYHVLEPLGTRPNVSYLARVTNPLDEARG